MERRGQWSGTLRRGPLVKHLRAAPRAEAAPQLGTVERTDPGRGNTHPGRHRPVLGQPVPLKAPLSCALTAPSGGNGCSWARPHRRLVRRLARARREHTAPFPSWSFSHVSAFPPTTRGTDEPQLSGSPGVSQGQRHRDGCCR